MRKCRHRWIWLLVLIAILSISSDVSSRDLKTLDGKTYRNFVVTKIEPIGIRIRHDDGFGLIDFMLLPEDLKKEFGFDQGLYYSGLEKKRDADSEALKAMQIANEAAAQKQKELVQKEEQKMTTLAAAIDSAVQLAVSNQPQTQDRSDFYDSSLARIPGEVSTYSAKKTSYSDRNYSSEEISGTRYVTRVSENSYPSFNKIHVKGYSRKDGTYVRPHSRRR